MFCLNKKGTLRTGHLIQNTIAAEHSGFGCISCSYLSMSSSVSASRHRPPAILSSIRTIPFSMPSPGLLSLIQTFSGRKSRIASIGKRRIGPRSLPRWGAVVISLTLAHLHHPGRHLRSWGKFSLKKFLDIYNGRVILKLRNSYREGLRYGFCCLYHKP